MFCQRCGQNMPDNIPYCQRCGAPMDDPPPIGSSTTTSNPAPLPAATYTNPVKTEAKTEDIRNPHAKAAAKRYKDAYFVANSINGIGTLVKILGIIAGIILFLLQAATASYLFRNEAAIVMSFITSFISGLVIYVVGVLVSAQGQMLKASLDSAVHSSPFLSDEHKAQVMSLSKEAGFADSSELY